MRVTETFKSCQGEGPGIEQPTVFVRFAGCNLAKEGTPCRWCDTPKSQCNQGQEYNISQLLERVKELAKGCRRVCLTGGEPLIQPTIELKDFISELKRFGYFVEVFTNGTLVPPLTLFRAVDCWVVDIKGPSSTAHIKCNLEGWMRVVRPQDMIKFVVADNCDLDYTLMAIDIYQPKAPISVSPCITSDLLNEPGELARQWMQRVWEFCVENNYRFGLQVHKVVFGNKEGV